MNKAHRLGQKAATALPLSRSGMLKASVSAVRDLYSPACSARAFADAARGLWAV